MFGNLRVGLRNHSKVEASPSARNVPGQSSSEQEVSETGTPDSNDTVLRLPDGSSLGQLLYPDEESTETSSSVQVRSNLLCACRIKLISLSFKETLWGATIDVIGDYLRKSEEDPEKVLEALTRAEHASANSIYSQFSLKVRVSGLIICWVSQSITRVP